MIPIVLGLSGLIAKAAAVVAVSRVAKVVAALASPPAFELAPAIEVHPASVAAPEQPAPVIKTPASQPKAVPGRWLIRSQNTAQTPSLPAWWAPTGARGPPLQIARSSFKASLHPRSYPINCVDPDGLEPIEIHNPSYPYNTIATYDSDTSSFQRIQEVSPNRPDLSPLETLRAMAGEHPLPSWVNAENASYVLLGVYVYSTWGSGNGGTFGGNRRGRGLPGSSRSSLTTEYKVSEQINKHMTGDATAGKSQFLMSVDPVKSTIDAAHYADKNNLWYENKATVQTRSPVGVYGKTGELTDAIKLYRTDAFNGVRHVHGAPGRPGSGL